MYKVKNTQNRADFPKIGEYNVLPSLTIPDQTMSLQTLLERYSRGLPLMGTEPTYYGEEELLPNMATLDISEVMELRENIAFRIKHMQEDIQEQQKAKPSSTQYPEASNTPPQETNVK